MRGGRYVPREIRAKDYIFDVAKTAVSRKRSYKFFHFEVVTRTCADNNETGGQGRRDDVFQNAHRTIRHYTRSYNTVAVDSSVFRFENETTVYTNERTRTRTSHDIILCCYAYAAEDGCCRCAPPRQYNMII